MALAAAACRVRRDQVLAVARFDVSMGVVKGVNGAMRFGVEVCALAALGCWGFAPAVTR
jgi:hypothetical protein